MEDTFFVWHIHAKQIPSDLEIELSYYGSEITTDDTTVEFKTHNTSEREKQGIIDTIHSSLKDHGIMDYSIYATEYMPTGDSYSFNSKKDQDT